MSRPGGTFTCFNPHSRTGSDPTQAHGISAHDCFNPHSRTGSDRHEVQILRRRSRFNPHSRTGSDVCKSCMAQYHIVSIHTPARGVTEDVTNSDTQRRVSIHTPARGVTAKTDNPICFCKAKIITNKQKISFLKIFLSFQHSFLHFSRCESYNKKMFTQYPHRLKN